MGIPPTNHLHTSLPHHHQALAHQTVQLNNSHPAAPLNHMNGISAHGQFTPTSLHQTQSNSLSPLPNHTNAKMHLALNQNITLEQCSQLRSRQILLERMEILNDLIRYQEEFEKPREDDLKNVPPYIESQGQSQLRHFTEMTILTVRLIVEFAKKVYGFENLTREDQITLLKASAGEIMMLRSTRCYDIKTDSILFANNQPFTRDNYRKAHIGEIADAMFNFCRSAYILRLNSAEYALITALIIFSERPNLREPEKVESIQEFYLELMHAYVESQTNSTEKDERCKFARLLSLLPELRALSIVNSDVCFSLKVKNQRLPEFLAEIWDVDQEKPEDDYN